MNATATKAPRKFGLVLRYPLTLLTLVGLACSFLASATHALYDAGDALFWIGVVLNWHLLWLHGLLFTANVDAPWGVVVAIGLVAVFLIDHFVLRRLTPGIWRIALYLLLALIAAWLIF
jgi:hypothetical protein